MRDIKVNLLTWRDERREQKKKEFLNVLVGVLVFAGVIIFGIDRYYNGEIETQKSRNNFLTKEIQVLEGRIAEIQSLQQQRNELLARMQVIQQLQGNRPIIVRVFDELASQLAERVFYNSVKLAGGKLEVRGVAEANPRISSQLRNYNESDWFANPNVTAITADPTFGPQASRFNLSVEQSTPKKEQEI